MPLIGVLFFLGLLFGPALVAGLIAYWAGHARAGVLAAGVGMVAFYVLAFTTAQDGSEQSAAWPILAAFFFLPTLALAGAGSFAGAALRRNRRAVS